MQSRILKGWFYPKRDDNQPFSLPITFQLNSLTTNHLPLNFPRRFSEGAERGDGVLEIEHLGVVVVCGIHGFQLGVVIEHMGFGLAAVVADESSCNAEPFAACKGAELHLGISLYLRGNAL